MSFPCTSSLKTRDNLRSFLLRQRTKLAVAQAVQEEDRSTEPNSVQGHAKLRSSGIDNQSYVSIMVPWHGLDVSPSFPRTAQHLCELPVGSTDIDDSAATLQSISRRHLDAFQGCATGGLGGARAGMGLICLGLILSN